MTPATNASRIESFRRMASSMLTDATVPARVRGETQPAGLRVRPSVGGWVPTHAKVIFFGTGANDSTYTAQIVGWANCGDQWIDMILWAGTVTLSNAVGAAGLPVLDTHRFADTLSTTIGTDGVTCSPISPANDTPAVLLVDLRGCEIVSLAVGLGGSATGANALFAGV